jgi:hypothetical protein
MLFSAQGDWGRDVMPLEEDDGRLATVYCHGLLW